VAILRAAGNAIVPQAAVAFIRALNVDHGGKPMLGYALLAWVFRLALIGLVAVALASAVNRLAIDPLIQVNAIFASIIAAMPH
jgi:hypothetical protein